MFIKRLLLIATLTFSLSVINSCGSDDPVEPVIEEIISAVNGLYYKQDVGETNVSPNMQFSVTLSNNPVTSKWVFFDLVDGDGTLSADSIATNSSGMVQLGYTFTDTVGNAVIEAYTSTSDTVQIILRKNMLIPLKQAHFVMLDDTYGTVKALIGDPDFVFVPTTEYRLDAVYEASLGFVAIMEDVDQDEVAHDNETMRYLIVNDNEDSPVNPANDYKGTFANGVGIGSTYSDVKTAFGDPDSLIAELSPPPQYWKAVYNSLDMRIYITYHPDTTQLNLMPVREIHIDRP